MKIIGFNGSPRINGSTAWAVGKILECAEGQGTETEMFHAGSCNIGPCKGCLACTKTGRCATDDGMQEIYAALKGADALVLGAPVYMGQMSAQAKAFTDRLFAQITPRFSPHFKEENAGKKLALVFTQGNPDPGRFQAYYDYTKAMFGLLEFEVQEPLIIADTRSEPASGQDGLMAGLQAVSAMLCRSACAAAV